MENIVMKYNKINKKPLAFILLAGIIVTSSSTYASNKPDSPESIDGATTITASKAKELFDNEVTFIDVRKDSDWDAGRIPGAIHLDIKKDKLTKESLIDEVATDESIVFYCNGVRCHRSSKGTKKAVEWGYSKVYYFRKGFPAWKAAGFPTE